VFVPSFKFACFTVNLLLTVSSPNIEDMEAPPTKLTPGKALLLTVTVLVGVKLQAGVLVNVGYGVEEAPEPKL